VACRRHRVRRGQADELRRGSRHAGQASVARRALERPAFYALRPGGWRDFVTLLHLPYTGWHLSYVAFGAAAAPTVHGGRLAATLGAFFLGVGVCAHALDERSGRPLGTGISDGALTALAAVSLAGAVALGVVGVATVSWSIAPFVGAGVFIVIAYNLELFGGRFHNDFWFAAGWGAFPAITSYWANALTLGVPGVLVTLACFGLSVAQRRLSTPVRTLRRKTASVTGTQTLRDGTVIELTAAGLAAPLDAALRALAVSLVLLAAALVVVRL
jgi:hypothetical protein